MLLLAFPIFEKYNIMNDKQIINRIKEGDNKGFSELYNKTEKSITKMVTNNSGSPQEAKDIVQDVVIVIWKKLTEDHDFVLTCKLSTYAYSVAWNLWRKQLRLKRKFAYEDYNSFDEPLEEYDFDFEIQEQVGIVQKALVKQPDHYQLLLNEYLKGLSMQKIATKLGYKNADVAKSMKCKAQQSLSEIIKENYSEQDIQNY
jgi:RNA polymerase sigma factor (sigma-70 family)